MNTQEKKIKIILQEVTWFSQAEFIRQEGFYVDYINQLKTPLNVSKEEYESILLRVQKMTSFVTEIIHVFDIKKEEFNNTIAISKDALQTYGYNLFEKVIEKFKHRNHNPLQILSKRLVEISAELDSVNSFKELDIFH